MTEAVGGEAEDGEAEDGQAEDGQAEDGPVSPVAGPGASENEPGRRTSSVSVRPRSRLQSVRTAGRRRG